MTAAGVRAESAAADLVGLLRAPDRLPSGARAALRVGVGLIRWSRRSADRAAAADRSERAVAAAASARARDRQLGARFLAGPR